METDLEKKIQEVSAVIEAQYFDLFKLLREQPFDGRIDIDNNAIDLKITNKKITLGRHDRHHAIRHDGSALSFYSRGGSNSYYVLQVQECFFQRKNLTFSIGEWDWSLIRDDFIREYSLPEFLKQCSAKTSAKKAFTIAKKIAELPKQILREVQKAASTSSFEDLITGIRREAERFVSSMDYLSLYNNQPENFKLFFGKLSEEEKVIVVGQIMANKESRKEIDKWLEGNFKEVVDNAGREYVKEAAE